MYYEYGVRECVFFKMIIFDVWKRYEWKGFEILWTMCV